MNIVDVLDKIVSKLNDGKGCDLCWKLVFAGRQDYLNLANANMDGDCCALVGIINNSFTAGYTTSNEFTTKRYNDWNIQLFAGIPSRLDIQFYDELRPEDKCNSKWAKYLYPIKCCLENLDVTICDVHNCSGCPTTVEIWNWQMNMKLNYLDGNFDGWLINATIREWLSQ